MATTKRISRRAHRSTDHTLILGYMRGGVSVEQLKARNGFFLHALAARHTRLGQIGIELWQEHGPALLAKHDPARLPERLEFFVRWYGRPKIAQD